MEKLKDKTFKLTPQRLAILGYLDGNKKHPSAEDIYSEVHKIFPTMSFSTVYNTLDTLKQRGYVSVLDIDPDKKRFDPDTEPHHHIICLKCKRIADIYREYELPTSDIERAGFEIISNHIEFNGICPECRKSGEDI